MRGFAAFLTCLGLVIGPGSTAALGACPTAQNEAAPKPILEIQYQNPPPASAGWWTARGGKAFPFDRSFEWDQIVAPGNEYDESIVGVSGWVIQPTISKIDFPMSHPFVSLTPNDTGILGDWEFKTFVDDQYFNLVSEANGYEDDGDGSTPDPGIDHVINGLHLPWPVNLNGLLGVEIESGLLPKNFQQDVCDGDRLAIFGRWIVDQGHPNKVYDAYRAEIHPPLVIATGSVQNDAEGRFTRVLFMSRPYLTGQKFTTDSNNVYDDSAGDDGAFLDHLRNELLKFFLLPPPLSSDQVRFHPKIKSHPFKGVHLLHFVVRPPPLPRRAIVSRPFQLAVSFNFTVRSGCAVQVISAESDRIDVLIGLNEVGYKPPKLPTMREHNWSIGDLDRIIPGGGDTMLLLKESLFELWAPVAVNGANTDVYDAVPEVDTLGTSGAVLNAQADNIPAGQGITVNNGDNQPFPVFGWLEARWVQPKITKR